MNITKSTKVTNKDRGEIVAFFDQGTSTGTIWIINQENKKVRCDFNTLEKQGNWFGNWDTLQDMYPVIRENDMVEIGGEYYPGIDLRMVGVVPEQEETYEVYDLEAYKREVRTFDDGYDEGLDTGYSEGWEDGFQKGFESQ